MSLRSAIIATIAAVAAISLVAKVEAAPMDNTRTLTRVNDIENNVGNERTEINDYTNRAWRTQFPVPTYPYAGQGFGFNYF